MVLIRTDSFPVSSVYSVPLEVEIHSLFTVEITSASIQSPFWLFLESSLSMFWNEHIKFFGGGESLQNVIRWILSLFQFCLLFLLNRNSRLLSNSLAQNSVTRGRFNGITTKEKEIHIKSFLHKILVSWSLGISEKSRGWSRNIGNSAS